MSRCTGLTPRELEVCNLLMTGLTNRQLATTLYVTENTVEFHLKNIFDKLRVRNRTEAVMQLMQVAA